VGLRCLACAHGLEVEVASPEAPKLAVSANRQWHFAAGLFAALALPWMTGAGAPLTALYELMLVMGLVIYYRAAPVRALVVGVLYSIILFMFVLIPLLDKALPAHINTAHLRLSDFHSNLSAGLICVIGVVGVVVYLLRPVRHVAGQLHEQGRDFLAGALAGSALMVTMMAFSATALLLVVAR
jgi:hypothetical protein